MKQADTWSIKEFGMESLILMERAALCAAQHIMSVQKPGCVFIMCGMGNNGADGLAMARILSHTPAPAHKDLKVLICILLHPYHLTHKSIARAKFPFCLKVLFDRAIPSLPSRFVQ